MPGFTTHYLFGQNTYQKLRHLPLKKAIRTHRAAYSLGLQGPDLFFYFLPSYAVHKNNIGSVAHTEKTNLFLRHLLGSRDLFPKQREQKIAEAYIAGFLGHYTLDTRCHPYVYWKTEFTGKNSGYHGRHIEFEADIDKELLRLCRGLAPSAFCQGSTIRLTRLQMRTVTKILHYAYRRTYPELGILPITIWASIRSFQLGAKFQNDPSGRKKSIIGALEKLAFGHPLFSALIPSDNCTVHDDPLNLLHGEWKNPWDTSLVSHCSFLELAEGAQEEYLGTLVELDWLFAVGTGREIGEIRRNKRCFPAENPCFRDPQYRERMETLLARLGNLSYHSGLDAGIPS